MAQNNSDEINLINVYSSLKKIVNNFLIKIFNFIEFSKRNWKILSLLIVIGLLLGYFTKDSFESNKKADIILKVNFEMVTYLYNEVALINDKIKENDTQFFNEIGFKSDTIKIRELELLPVVNLKDIVKNYGGLSQYLENLLENLEFDKKETDVTKTFTSEYKYHILHLELTNKATSETIDKLLNYLNSNTMLDKIKQSNIVILEERIANDLKTIKQIDNVIESYNNESLPSQKSDVFVLEKSLDVDLIIERKINLQRQIERTKEDLLLADDTIVAINKSNISKVESSFNRTNLFYYPIVFVSLFYILAIFKNTYLFLKELASK